MGALTLAIAAVADEVVAIEFDRGLLPILEEVLELVPNVRVIHADAMALDFEEVTKGRQHRFVGNLPYNIATPLVARVLEDAPSITDMVIMVQREVGERLVAIPGSRAYGAISVRVRYHCDTQHLGRIPKSVFWPVPKVESILIQLTRREPPVAVPSTRLMSVVRAAFGQRRKTIRNSLVNGLDLDVQLVAEALASARIDPEVRPEMLGLEEYARLAEALPDFSQTRGPM